MALNVIVYSELHQYIVIGWIGARYRGSELGEYAAVPKRIELPRRHGATYCGQIGAGSVTNTNEAGGSAKKGDVAFG